MIIGNGWQHNKNIKTNMQKTENYKTKNRKFRQSIRYIVANLKKTYKTPTIIVT